MVPGLVAWGVVVCTGSNLVIRAQALQRAGFFPGQTITEDFALGLELNKQGYRAAYLGKYLASGADLCSQRACSRTSSTRPLVFNAQRHGSGEAPEEGAIFRQRSRWCKGHLQVECACCLRRHDLALGDGRAC